MTLDEISAVVDAIETGFWDTAKLPEYVFDAVNSAVLKRIDPLLEKLASLEHP